MQHFVFSQAELTKKNSLRIQVFLSTTKFSHQRILRASMRLSGGRFCVDTVNKHCLMNVNKRFSSSSYRDIQHKKNY